MPVYKDSAMFVCLFARQRVLTLDAFESVRAPKSPLDATDVSQVKQVACVCGAAISRAAQRLHQYRLEEKARA